jgi:hypothetical protein
VTDAHVLAGQAPSPLWLGQGTGCRRRTPPASRRPPACMRVTAPRGPIVLMQANEFEAELEKSMCLRPDISCAVLTSDA